MKRAIRILRIVMPIVGLICAIVFPPWDGILAWMAPLPDTVQQQVDDGVDHGLDGIIVYVDRRGEAPAVFCSGWKDRAGQVPADPEALFKIGSISKLYIAAAVAKLVDSQRLSLDDTLVDYLPELVGRVEFVEQITLRMLVQHRSGVPSYTDHDGFDWSRPPSGFSEALALALEQPADFRPGTKYRYSNTNYLLIGKILDSVLGYSHRRYIEEEILAPLGVRHTYGSLDEVESENVVLGYHRPYEADFKDVEFVSPGGSMVATAEDVGIFLRALNDGTLLSRSEQSIYSSIYESGHKGWVLGYQSIARYHDDLDAVVVQFVNTTGKDTELTAMVVYDRVVRILRRPDSASSG